MVGPGSRRGPAERAGVPAGAGRAALLLATIGAMLSCASAVAWLVTRADGFSSRAPPSGIEAAVARAARALATPARVRDRVAPTPVGPDMLADARLHWAAHCAFCHAADGSGATPIGAAMYPRPGDLREPRVQALTDGELYGVIQNGVRLTGMPAFGRPGVDDDAESWALVAFLRTLPALDEASLAEVRSNLPKTPHELAAAAEEEDFLRGGPARPTHGPAHEEHAR